MHIVQGAACERLAKIFSHVCPINVRDHETLQQTGQHRLGRVAGQQRRRGEREVHVVRLPFVRDQAQLAGHHAARRHGQRLPQ